MLAECKNGGRTVCILQTDSGASNLPIDGIRHRRHERRWIGAGTCSEARFAPTEAANPAMTRKNYWLVDVPVPMPLVVDGALVIPETLLVAGAPLEAELVELDSFIWLFPHPTRNAAAKRAIIFSYKIIGFDPRPRFGRHTGCLFFDGDAVFNVGDTLDFLRDFGRLLFLVRGIDETAQL